jgi:methionine-rich copper-binding protein CopC
VFSISDGAGGILTGKSFDIELALVNDPPVIFKNIGLSVVQSEEKTITLSELDVRDPDTAAGGVVHTVTVLPTNGVLKNKGTLINLNDTFTRADVQANNITYTNTSATSSDKFTFVASDGTSSLPAADFIITVGDTSPPTATGFTPSDGAVNVAVNSVCEITFDENIMVGTGNIEIRNTAGGALFKQIDITDGTQVSFSANKVSIDPDVDFAEQTDYYITIESGAITDQSANHNAYAGISSSTDWNFVTEDKTAPSVTILNPLDNATNVTLATNLVMQFDENVQKGTGNIILYKSGGQVVETIDVTSGLVTVLNDLVTVNPTNDLEESTGYYVNIPSGVITDVSSNLNPFGGITGTDNWNFTTGDFTSPSVIGIIPVDDAVDISVDATLTLNFDEKFNYLLELRASNNDVVAPYAEKFPNARFIQGKKPWNEKVDMAFPCAIQNELNENDAKQLIENGCKYAVETSNMGCTAGAVSVFQENKVGFGPGKAANAGGVAVSGLEMSQNGMKFSWTSEEVDEKLKRIMTDIHAAGLKYGKREDGYVDYVKGSNIAGFIKVADSMLDLGY